MGGSCSDHVELGNVFGPCLRSPWRDVVRAGACGAGGYGAVRVIGFLIHWLVLRIAEWHVKQMQEVVEEKTNE